MPSENFIAIIKLIGNDNFKSEFKTLINRPRGTVNSSNQKSNVTKVDISFHKFLMKENEIEIYEKEDGRSQEKLIIISKET